MNEKNLRKKIIQMEQQIIELTDALGIANEKLKAIEAKRDLYKSKYLQFKGIFRWQTHAFCLYQRLSKQSKESLAGIFRGTSFEEFLACGVQPGNIDTLWEFSRNLALQGNTEDIVILEQLITYFVHLYNVTNESPILAFQKVETGDAFDVDLHIRTQTSKAAGTISRVLITGLTNAYTGDVIKKAVVEVK